MADAFVGLDLGTTGIKAVAFDADDRELTSATLPTPTHALPDGGAEYDADELWATAARVLRTVTNSLAEAGHQSVAIATASMGEAGVLLDSSCQPLTPIIAWFDPRTAEQAEWWVDAVGVDRTHRIAAIPCRPVFGACKMLWTQTHLPDKWAAGRHWLNMADWTAYRLTGQMATDHSLASRTMLFDLSTRQWSDELIDAAGLDRSMLAPLIPSGARVGAVTADAAAETGLSAGTVVGAGGQDHVCAALALGVTEPGMLLDSIGTAEAFFLVTAAVDTTGRIATAGIGQGAHVVAGQTYAMSGLQQGGGRIDARRHEMDLDWADFLATPEAEQVIDEVATEGQARITTLLDVSNTTTARHIATGGGSRNERLIERKREIGDRPIEVASSTEATALGAAMLGRQAMASET